MTWHSQFQLDTNALKNNKSFSVRVTIVITTSWQNVCAVSVCICPLLCASLRVVSPLVCCLCASVWWGFCPRSKKGVPSCCSLPSRQTDLCSNLCSTPVIAVTTDPSDPVNGGFLARTPHGQGLKVLQVFKGPFFMLVLHLLVQRSCRICVTTWCCRKTRSERQWHHGVSSLRSTRQRFRCGIVQEKLCGESVTA